MSDSKPSLLPGRLTEEADGLIEPEWVAFANEVTHWLAVSSGGSMYNEPPPSALYDIIVELVSDLGALLVVRNGEHALTTLLQDSLGPALEKAETLREEPKERSQ